jgi:hypothetical protein
VPWQRLRNPVSSRGIFLLATTKLEEQEDIALAITATAVADSPITTRRIFVVHL